MKHPFTHLRRRALTIALCAAALGSLSSCTQTPVNQFVERFVENANLGNSPVLQQMYMASGGDSICGGYTTKDIVIEEDTPGVFYKAHLAPDAYIIVEQIQPDSFQITNSHNVIFFSPEQTRFGLRTGLIDDHMLDAERSERFMDNRFLAFMYDRTLHEVKKQLKMSSIRRKGDDIVFWLSNDSTRDLPAVDFTYRVDLCNGSHVVLSKELTDIDIPAGGKSDTLRISTVKDGRSRDVSKVEVEIVPRMSRNDFTYRYATPQEQEYVKYCEKIKRPMPR